MEFLRCLTLVVILALPYSYSFSNWYADTFLPKKKWFTQKLDHTNEEDKRTFNQLFYKRKHYYKYEKTSPVFLYVGGLNGNDSNGVMKRHYTWINFAMEHGAFCFYLEHRYYGDSLPFKRTMITKDLKYLTVEQALLDIKAFIEGMKNKFSIFGLSYPTHKWILFGNSFGGSLATWAKMKFPHLIHGVIASSAPLELVPFYSGYEKVYSDTIKGIDGLTPEEGFFGRKCFSKLLIALNKIKDMIARENYKDLVSLYREFSLCEPVDPTNDQEKQLLFYSIQEIFFHKFSYNNLYSVPELLNGVHRMCNIMNNISLGADPLERLGNIIQEYYNDRECFDFKVKNHFVDIKEVIIAKQKGKDKRVFTYQICRELGGFFVSSDVSNYLFGNTFTESIAQETCKSFFGISPKETVQGVENLMEQFSVVDILTLGTNLIFTHGSTDPFLYMGISENNLNRDIRSFIFKGYGQSIDSFIKPHLQTEQFKTNIAEINKTISKWLKK